MWSRFGSLRSPRLHHTPAIPNLQKKCYTNAISGDIINNVTVVSDADAPLTIGWSEEYATFDGALDDVRIYNRALSGAEITALYNE